MKKAFNWELGFVECLGLVFIAEKLADKISWSWWSVLSPFWIPKLLQLTGWFISIIYEGFLDALKNKRTKEQIVHNIQTGTKARAVN